MAPTAIRARRLDRQRARILGILAPPPVGTRPIVPYSPADGARHGHRGFFFRSSDPEALARWYEANLGIDPTPTSYDGIDMWGQVMVRLKEYAETGTPNPVFS